MKEEVLQLLTPLWQNHSGKICGFLASVIIGTAVLCFGFWHTFFVLACGLVGLFVGLQLDNGDDILHNIREKAWNLLERFQR